ncbi:MAG: ABC transporter ATP-binding protein [Anaerolineae bacterium]|nr:ABC transporter ATP-binding protein [Anaerolineae bacterium]
MSELAVELSNVFKTFSASNARDVNAVRNVNLAIRAGEFFTLLGPSGCGKTTTLRLIAGFEQPTRGEVRIQGKPMNGVPPYRRPVNTVFQNYALFPHLSVQENVGFGLAIKRVSKEEKKKRVQAALDLVELPQAADRKPSQLSGGQQQRVALARALVNQPAVLLLDEPLGALDLKLRKNMQLELKHMQELLKLTFIYVTHDQEEALTMSDRIAVMSAGNVLQIGAPIEIYEKPATRFVADFIGETNFLNGRVVEMGTAMTGVEVTGKRINLPRQNEFPTNSVNVTLTVRPEKVGISRPESFADEAKRISFSGVIREAVYIGTDTRYLVGLSNAETLVARLQSSPGHRPGEYAIDDPVIVWFEPGDIRLLTE